MVKNIILSKKDKLFFKYLGSKSYKGETLDLKAYLEERRGLVNRALKAYLPQVRGPAFRLNRAMHYSLFVGGKRLRPILCLAAAEAVGGDPGEALPVA